MRLDKLSWAAFVREAEAKGSDLFEFLLARAAGELETDKASVLARLSAMLKVMEESVAYGLTGVPSNSGLTGGNAQKMAQAFPRKENERFMRLLGPLASDAVLYATAVTECNAAMGRICAAPTAGASGIVPGVLLALRKHEDLSRTELVEGLLVAGVIGEVIADRAAPPWRPEPPSTCSAATGTKSTRPFPLSSRTSWAWSAIPWRGWSKCPASNAMPVAPSRPCWPPKWPSWA